MRTLRSGQEQDVIQHELTLQFQKLKQRLTLSSMLKLITLTSLGIIGRVALQWLPSVEPIVAISIGTSFFLGYRYGLPSGMSAFYLSNFLVWGGQGPWTIFQVIGTGAASLTGYLFGRASKSKYSLLFATVLGTLAYELIVDMSFMTFGILSPVILFLVPLPFTITHIISSTGFSMVIYGFKDKISDILHETFELRLHSIRRLASGDGNASGKQLDRFVHVLSIRRWNRKRDS